ncbi:LysR substrate-binding domain-containing protein [Rhizobium etli]|uniref:DNA-binding transcriptional LysR family regulator n=1 Tax=Rhizobium etli TaxID=29449 RepID=A0A7W6ZPG3_RHIET|nr:LysR substrate-binding domain-containing protein [Rhizobium etli]MBB4483597.1 DNA-binding transcriptional LysR family regulator [Rhizobium etli]MBB4539427.1 DNA-binding transcriptional LysR family regulator [Rhizobium etli]
MRQLPPMSSLRSFEAAARLGTMTAAASELGRTHGAISRQIAQLEQATGQLLFQRAGVLLKLTPAGSDLFAVTVEALDRLEESFTSVRGGRQNQVITLGCGSTFASRWLIPRLPRFYELHPNVTVKIDVLKRSASEARGVSIATSWDRLSYPVPEGSNVYVLGDVEFVIVGHPQLDMGVSGKAFNMPTRLRSLTSPHHWEAFEQKTGFSIHAKTTMDFANTQQCIDAAVAGLGFVLVEARMIDEELKTGRLIAHPPSWRMAAGFVAMTSGQTPSSILRKFISWLVEQSAINR